MRGIESQIQVGVQVRVNVGAVGVLQTAARVGIDHVDGLPGGPGEQLGQIEGGIGFAGFGRRRDADDRVALLLDFSGWHKVGIPSVSPLGFGDGFMNHA